MALNDLVSGHDGPKSKLREFLDRRAHENGKPEPDRVQFEMLAPGKLGCLYSWGGDEHIAAVTRLESTG